jgi:phenylpropionate dioxygenase-like ring-hydroxylating dioxygenase large terminal subunit
VDRQTANALNRRLLEHIGRNTTDTAATEIRIAAAVFTCPRHFARERQQLYRSVPQPVAFSAEVPEPGSYLALQVLDLPVLLVRDAGGTLRAFINACAHRAAQIATDSGLARRLVCPFHGWSYELDGQLAARPGEEYFDSERADCALTPLPVAEDCGIVVIGPGNDFPADRINTALDEVATEIAGFDLANHVALGRRHYQVQANWKLVNNLSLESYHFATLHRDSVAAVLAPNAVVDTWERTSRWAFPLKTIDQLSSLPEEQWPARVEGSCTYTLYPGVMVLVNASGAQMIRAEPGDRPGSSRVVYAGLRHPDSEPSAAQQAFAFGGDVFEREDLPVAEQCQRGLAGARDLLLGRNEPLLQFWHRLWDEATAP